MQDSTPGWTRYIEELEAQAAQLPRRRRAVLRRGWLAAIAGFPRRVAAWLAGRSEIDG